MTRPKPKAPPTPPALSLGDRLALARKRLHLGQAAMADLAGVSRHTVSKWERDIIEPRLTDAARWAELTKVPLDWLATGHNPRHDTARHQPATDSA